MKLFSKFFFLALAMIFCGALAAQEIAETNRNVLSYYDTELFQWSYSMFGGLTLNFQNQNAITIFGVKDTMKNAFTQYEEVNQRYRSYRGKTIAGNILMWGGFAAVLAGAYVPIYSGSFQDNNSFERDLRIGLGIMAGGLVTELIGAFLLQSGQENIFDAVNLYNRRRIADYK